MAGKAVKCKKDVKFKKKYQTNPLKFKKLFKNPLELRKCR